MDRPSNSQHIQVIGAGVSGLTTAMELLSAGYEVSICCRDLPGETVSAVAAAIWFPYEAYPLEKVNQWSFQSYRKFLELTAHTETGVSLIPFRVLVPQNKKPFWLNALPESSILKTRPGYPENNLIEYLLKVPLIETPVYLPYLLEEIQAQGGKIIHKEINSPDDPEMKKWPLTINCSGLGSEKLFGDSKLFPVQGQVLRIPYDPEVDAMSTDYHLGENKDEMAYIIPRHRSGDIILGGSARKNKYSTDTDPELTKRIQAYCCSYDPRVEDCEVLEVKTGLRPARDTIRLEKDPELNIIHNYGHGGAGFTVSWGCAREVRKLADSFFSSKSSQE